MRQSKCAVLIWVAALWLGQAAPAWAHPDPGTRAGGMAYLIAAAIAVFIFTMIVWGGRIAAWLRSAIRTH